MYDTPFVFLAFYWGKRQSKNIPRPNYVSVKNKPFQVLYPQKDILNLMFKIEPHIVYYDQCPIDDMLEPNNLSSCFFIFLN